MKTVSIVGFGRFGQTLYKLLKGNFSITLYNRSIDVFTKHELDTDTRIAKSLGEVYESDTVFFAVPIESFESVLKKHKSHFRKNLLIDVLSVKEYPERVFRKYLKNTDARSLLTHPLFGPDSSKRGFVGLPLVMDRSSSTAEEYESWKTYFAEKGLRIFEMTATEHDRMVVDSQGLTHFVGRLLAEMDIHPSPIDTLGAKKLQEVVEQTCNDTWELFSNLQTYNKYTKQMRLRLGKAYDVLYDKLLPKHVTKNKLIFGIQGGRGSFNEEALHDYVIRHGIKKYGIKYLYTTEKVLKNLHEGKIDFGLFAIQNAIGGVVQESTHAMARYRFKIREEFRILIAHYLMKRKDIQFSDIKTIMAHDQVFKQCHVTLGKKYPSHIQKVGEGDYIDHAKVAWGLAKGVLPKQIAVLGPRILATLYDFDVVDEDLQDSKENYTTFFMVSR